MGVLVAQVMPPGGCRLCIRLACLRFGCIPALGPQEGNGDFGVAGRQVEVFRDDPGDIDGDGALDHAPELVETAVVAVVVSGLGFGHAQCQVGEHAPRLWIAAGGPVVVVDVPGAGLENRGDHHLAVVRDGHGVVLVVLVAVAAEQAAGVGELQALVGQGDDVTVAGVVARRPDFEAARVGFGSRLCEQGVYLQGGRVDCCRWQGLLEALLLPARLDPTGKLAVVVGSQKALQLFLAVLEDGVHLLVVGAAANPGLFLCQAEVRTREDLVAGGFERLQAGGFLEGDGQEGLLPGAVKLQDAGKLLQPAGRERLRQQRFRAPEAFGLPGCALPGRQKRQQANDSPGWLLSRMLLGKAFRSLDVIPNALCEESLVI